jgi:hypothetical protein
MISDLAGSVNAPGHCIPLSALVTRNGFGCDPYGSIFIRPERWWVHISRSFLGDTAGAVEHQLKGHWVGVLAVFRFDLDLRNLPSAWPSHQLRDEIPSASSYVLIPLIRLTISHDLILPRSYSAAHYTSSRFRYVSRNHR